MNIDLERVADLPDTWGFGDEDTDIAHVAACQDYGCKDCVAIACAADLRAALATPAPSRGRCVCRGGPHGGFTCRACR